MTNYVPFEEVLAEDLQDPAERAEWDRMQLARDVAVWLLLYRKKHRLTQTQLARQLDWPQSVVARLEGGDREPSIATLHRLVERLGVTATIVIRPERIEVRFTRRRGSTVAAGHGGAASGSDSSSPRPPMGSVPHRTGAKRRSRVAA